MGFPAGKGWLCMDFEKLERELKGKSGLNALAKTPEGRAIASQLDDDALRTAAKNGDTAALQDALRRVLSTPEGKALAEKVQKAVGKK